MIRMILFAALVAGVLTACAPRQPPGQDLWRIPQMQEQLR